MKPRIGKCKRCKTWEIVYPGNPNDDLFGGYYIDGFKTWKDALEYFLKSE